MGKWYTADFDMEIPINDLKPFKVLIFGVPGTPIHEMGKAISEYYDIDLFAIEREYDDYWEDKYRTVYLDMGDGKDGSESQRERREPMADSSRRAIDRFLNVPNGQSKSKKIIFPSPFWIQ